MANKKDRQLRYEEARRKQEQKQLRALRPFDIAALVAAAAVLLIGCMLDAVGFSAASAEGGAGLPYGVRLGLVLVLAGGILLSLCLAGICFRPGGKKKPEEGPSSPDHHAESHRMSGH